MAPAQSDSEPQHISRTIYADLARALFAKQGANITATLDAANDEPANGDGKLHARDDATHTAEPSSERALLHASTVPSSPSVTVITSDQPPAASAEIRHDPDGVPLLKYFLAETQSIRNPAYQVGNSAADADDAATKSYFDLEGAHQLPLRYFEYDENTTVISHLGELTVRDMLVMSVITQIFFEAGCPADGKITGDQATFGYIARQLGMNPAGSTASIRKSLERLETAKVRLKLSRKLIESGGYEVNEEGEVDYGFLSGMGSRTRKRKGVPDRRTNFIRLDAGHADLVRNHHFIRYRADIVRAIRNDRVLLKVFYWARSHRPNERGELLEYGVVRLARQLGYKDTNPRRLRKRVIEAVENLCTIVPEEFPSFKLRQGKHDLIITLKRVVPPSLRVVARGDTANVSA